MLNCFCYPFPKFHTPLHCAQGCDLPFLLVPSLSSLSVEPSQFSLVVYCAWFGCHAAVELDTFSTGKHSKIVPRSDYPKQDSLEQIRRDLAWHARGEPWARPAPAGCCSARRTRCLQARDCSSSQVFFRFKIQNCKTIPSNVCGTCIKY